LSRSTTATSPNHRVLLRYFEILNSGDPEHLDEVLAPGYVQVIPQSGEILRGVESFAQVMRNWPASTQAHPDLLAAEVIPVEVHDVGTAHAGMFPTYSLLRIEGDGDTLTSYSLVRYPDGDDWFCVSIATFSEGKIAKELWFFGPLFAAPAWRSKWASIMSPEEQLEFVGFAKG